GPASGGNDHALAPQLLFFSRRGPPQHRNHPGPEGRTLTARRHAMRIAILTEVFLPKVDGVVSRTLNLIRHLLRLGDEVLVLCPQAEGCTAAPAPVVDFPSF